MNPINQLLVDIAKRTPRNVLTPDEQLDKMLRSSTLLKKFQREHPEVTRDDYLRALSTVYGAVKEHYFCEKCPGLEKCPNLVKGHYTELHLANRQIVGSIAECDLSLAQEDKRRTQRLMRSYYIAEETLAASFQEMVVDEDNGDAVKAALRFCNTFDPKKPSAKGIYLYGGFGAGKSYIMGAIARELSHKNVASLMVYVPDFIREIKESLGDNSYTNKLNVLKDVQVLILDDIGAETVTPWVRDEVLGVILHHRVNNNLPTLYTSNYSFEELEGHLSISGANRIENTKASRILERIRHYVDAFYMDGKNRRRAL
ncbi:primosomal protein DnaI [Brevibacillus dissolubilis]|uniref:primosomal protein DnaI n=1 Tax=Brevibacillus dissolubilis TaxID=1844116 RepID=UPI001116C0BB|nr:primosomal protein DnaI [Brevibacillus dissolubilis]